MKCQTCKLGSGSLIDMAPGRDPNVLHCTDEHCTASVTLNDLGFQPAYFSPIPGPALTPTNTTLCRWEPCSAPFVALRGAHYCGEACRFQARQAARKAYHVTPGVKQRSERTARILATAHALLAFADPSDAGWCQ